MLKVNWNRKLSKSRCPWLNLNNDLYVRYHDQEWGKPVHDDLVHFEFITLEGAQAGLSWETVLNKRENYRKLFANFDPKRIARFSSKKIAELLIDPGIVRNRLKVESTVSNAQAFLKIQSEFGSFDRYIWGFVANKPIVNHFTSTKEYPTHTDLSDQISKDLKKRGFRFVGTTIVYAYMQAVGIVDDHVISCATRINKLKAWYVYMIRCADNSLYTGITNDIARRFNEHQSQSTKCAKYLRGKAPLKLVFQLGAESKSAALQLEAKFKSLSKLEKELVIKSVPKP
jgi:DNA-3-methyladenine glycosylase I